VILVDSSVWIDDLRGAATPQIDKLDGRLGSVPLAIGDLILAEVLQGCRTDREFDLVRNTLSALNLIAIGGGAAAVEAALNFRRLRDKGLTVRKTIDTLIATRCILDGLELLHDERDFDPFEQHLGRRCVRCDV
jgi:predicted nucleic acid-binding protein